VVLGIRGSGGRTSRRGRGLELGMVGACSTCFRSVGERVR